MCSCCHCCIPHSSPQAIFNIYWGFIGIMEKKMETTIVYWGYSGDNGEENGDYYSHFQAER